MIHLILEGILRGSYRIIPFVKWENWGSQRLDYLHLDCAISELGALLCKPRRSDLWAHPPMLCCLFCSDSCAPSCAHQIGLMGKSKPFKKIIGRTLETWSTFNHGVLHFLKSLLKKVNSIMISISYWGVIIIIIHLHIKALGTETVFISTVSIGNDPNVRQLTSG